jgi:hypothetical protein
MDRAMRAHRFMKTRIISLLDHRLLKSLSDDNMDGSAIVADYVLANEVSYGIGDKMNQENDRVLDDNTNEEVLDDYFDKMSEESAESE